MEKLTSIFIVLTLVLSFLKLIDNEELSDLLNV